MTKLLDEAIHRLRQLPAPLQDSAARAVILQLEEEPEPGDREAVAGFRSTGERWYLSGRGAICGQCQLQPEAERLSNDHHQ